MSFSCWQFGTSMELPWESTKTSVAQARATSTSVERCFKKVASLWNKHLNIEPLLSLDFSLKKTLPGPLSLALVSFQNDLRHETCISLILFQKHLMEYFQQTSRHIAILQLLGDSMANHHWRNLNLPHDGQERDGVPMADVTSQNPCAGVLKPSQNHHKKHKHISKHQVMWQLHCNHYKILITSKGRSTCCSQVRNSYST